MIKKSGLMLVLLSLLAISCARSPAVLSTASEAENQNAVVAQASGDGVAQPASQPASSTLQAPRVIFVLDASGSMLGKAADEEKMAAARRVLKEAIGKLPETAEVGLIAYGHRRKSDCDDIEVVASLATIDKAVLGQRIDALDPKGMTPITNALRQAFDAARQEEGDRAVTIVLVSDGLETCGGDPCRLTREAKAAGVKFVTHVIGFDVGKISVAQLECIAQAGDGRYFGAESANDLAEALAGAVAPVAVADSRLSVKAMIEGKLTDVVVRIRRSGTKDEVAHARTYESPETNPRIVPLPAGAYEVEVQAIKLSNRPRRRLEVKIEAGETIERTVDFGSGELAIAVTRNGKLSDASITVYTAGTKEQVAAGRSYVQASSNPRVFRIEPGEYDVVIKALEIADRPEFQMTRVTVESGKTTRQARDFTSGTLRIGARLGSQLVDATVYITNTETNSRVGGRTYANSSSNPRAFELQPGKYLVQLNPLKPAGLGPQEIVVTVAAGETVEQTVEFKQ